MEALPRTFGLVVAHLAKEGRGVSVGQCAVSYSAREIRRPGSTLVSTAHTHPRGDLFPDPRPDSRRAQDIRAERLLVRLSWSEQVAEPEATRL